MIYWEDLDIIGGTDFQFPENAIIEFSAWIVKDGQVVNRKTYKGRNVRHVAIYSFIFRKMNLWDFLEGNKLTIRAYVRILQS